jgi:formylglycine-generating enzyme required for sulfatase activity
VAVLSGCPLGLQNPLPGTTRIFHGIEFQWCPAGAFTMGSPANEVGRDADETQHQVTLRDGFWLSRFEVTQSQWERVMGNNPSDFSGADRPVEMVSWEDVQEFLAELNSGFGFGGGEFRLPTEAEWEYACRAGTATRFYWGDDLDETAIDDYAWYADNSGTETQLVGGKLPNAWGLYDMSGNVYEWCQDWYDDYPDWPLNDPEGPEDGFDRVARGGGFDVQPSGVRSACRPHLPPDFHDYAYGFRLLRTAD